MNKIKAWIAARPFTAICLSSYFTITAAIAGFRDDLLYHMLFLLCIGLLVMIISMKKFTGTMILVIAALLRAEELPPQKTDPPVAEGMMGVAVVVVVVGGVCIYLLVRTCQRVFPKTPAPSTNSPPNINGRPDDTAGSWSYYAPVSCYEPMSEQQWPQVTMELSGTIEENEDGPFFNLMASRKISSEENSQDYLEFQSDLARHGITIGPVGTMNYGRNGSPAYEHETNIRFYEFNSEHVACVNSDTAPSVKMVVQRSFDLKTWTDFGFVSMPIGQRFKLIDTTTKMAAFYRIQKR